MLSPDHKRAIQEEERERHRARREIADEEARREDRRAERDAIDAEHGSGAAFMQTFLGWIVAGVVFGIMVFVEALKDGKGFGEAVGSIFPIIGVFALIGAWRGMR